MLSIREKTASPGGWENQANDGDGAGQAEGWGNQKDDKRGSGWGDEQKTSSRRGPSQSNAKSKSGGISRGDDGGPQPKFRDAATITSVVRPVVKSYWAEWDRQPAEHKKPRGQPRDAYVYPAPSSITAPAGKALKVSHGVQAGRGADYMHKLYRPEYLDTMQQPYAIFTFKYRSKAALEKILGRRIDTSDVQKAVHEVEQERLMRLPKDELVAELMKRGMGTTRSSKPQSEHVSKPSSKASKTPSNNCWGEKPRSNAGGKWDAEVKPSDSVSNVASQPGGGWEELGQGEVQVGRDCDKAVTEQHWDDDDPQLKVNW